MTPSILDRLPWKFRDGLPAIEGDERLIVSLRSHWMIFLPLILTVIPLGLCIGLMWLGFFFGLSTTGGMASVGAAMLLSTLTLHWFFHWLLSVRLNMILITNRRILFLFGTLWLDDELHEIILQRVEAVEVRKRGLLQNIFDYGDLWFDTGGSNIAESQTIPFFPHPYHWAKELSRIAAPKMQD